MGNSHILVLILFFMFPFNSLLTCSSPSTASPFLCHPHQSHALLQFKSTFSIDIRASRMCGFYGVPSSPKTESWEESSDCCYSWDGVTCDEVTGHVIELDLSCSLLVGTIHSNSSLFSSHIAPYLQRLNLAFNRFHGSNISSQFGVKFGSSLTHVNLSESKFNGNIPSKISHLSNLVSLDLSANYNLRVGSDRVLERIARNLTHLKVLDLSGVDMSSLVHASSSLMNLSSTHAFLRLALCELQGQFPTSFLLRPNLQKLDVRYNKFSPITALPEFNSTNLTYFYLNEIDLSSVSIGFLDRIGNSKSLRVLDLSNCSLSGPIPSSFCDMTHLSYLDLGDNELNGPLPSCLFTIPSLEKLVLSNNNLHGQIPTSLSESMNLTWVDLSYNNNLSSSTSTSASSNLSYFLPRFRHLDLSSCNLTQFPTFLPTLSNLTFLDLSNNKIQGSLPTLPTTIKFFKVSSNSISGEISSLICNASSLEVFDLSQNKFVGLLPPCIGNLTRLSVLNLGTNNLYGTIPNTFAKDSSMSYLILNENQLRGRLPHSLSYCQYLKVLDVGNNMIEDVFPHRLEVLSTLQVLVLRSNKLFGPVDGFKSHTSFPSLRIIDVSGNNLTGRLPMKLINNLEAMVDVNEGRGYGRSYMTASNTSSGFIYYSMTITTKGLEMEYEKTLSTLTVIDFSRNRFEGDIPRVIGKLGLLNCLNLSLIMLSS